ncbi:cupin-like domain-containing protein [Massilia sp. PAMC28688]|uniref:cupin-like domain-containing protein n=1 Tax=Massilia sp. PAMC28688 TaxID=2861283 RepID=UPI001C6375B6|nr:cupin-like domain-containing protein [Massilia sp. PAMC28688]QYF94121.1 cupin-like domain-containing protein [Massilia sp. PAMC28688]
MTSDQVLPEFQAVDGAAFQAIVAGEHPAILRGFVRHWPAVRRALASPEDLCGYLMECDSGAPVDALLAGPQEQGRLFYSAGMKGFNFVRRKLPLSAVIEQLARYSQFADPPSVAVQSALLDECAPRFAREHMLPFLDAAVRPRIWLGNTITTPAHVDQSHNLACVVAGRRRFTLFPPDQVGNLYIGPLDFAPTPTPISMVDFAQPDHARFPRFRQALAHALVADLVPGDALFIPTLWWHHVQSHGMLNMLVNYWWQASAAVDVFDSMVACMQALGALPPAQRRAWAALFGHYVFDPAHPGAHIDPHARGVLSGARPSGPAP